MGVISSVPSTPLGLRLETVVMGLSVGKSAALGECWFVHIDMKGWKTPLKENASWQKYLIVWSLEQPEESEQLSLGTFQVRFWGLEMKSAQPWHSGRAGRENGTEEWICFRVGVGRLWIPLRGF